jgi:16S rRNA (uracil1498-N3)-methyltransferase
MQKHRFYAPRSQIKGGRAVMLADEAHHLSRVLRLNPGDEVFVFDGEGTEHKCRIDSVGKDIVEAEIVETVRSSAESPIDIRLAQALVKGEKFDLIVQKATELGVSAITPLETDHSDIKFKEEQADKKVERWRRISLESLKQCGRSRLVEIDAPVRVDEFIESHMQSWFAMVFSEKGGLSITSAVSSSSNRSKVVAIVGPEGGWSERELGIMIGKGCVPVTLGPRTLRTETAALAAVTLIQHHLGDISNRDRD